MRWVVLPPFSYIAEFMKSLNCAITWSSINGSKDPTSGSFLSSVCTKPFPHRRDPATEVVLRSPASECGRLIDARHPARRLVRPQYGAAVLRAYAAAATNRDDHFDHVADLVLLPGAGVENLPACIGMM